MKKYVSFIFLIAILIAVRPEMASANSFKGMLILTATAQKSGARFNCNAFQLRKGVAITPEHCLVDQMKTDATLISVNGIKVKAKVNATDPINDIAILTYDYDFDGARNTFRSTALTVNEDVTILYRNQSFTEFSYSFQNSVIEKIFTNAVLLQATGDLGWSGSPVLDTSGSIVGMVTVGAKKGNEYRFKTGQILIVPWNKITATFPELR